MTGCLVAGEIVCGKAPLGGARIDVTLLDNDRKPDPRYTATATSDTAGDWAVSINIADEEGGNFFTGFARCDITCPNGKKHRVQVKMEAGQAGLEAVKKMVKVILDRIGDKLLRKVLGLDRDDDLSVKLLSTDFVKILAWGTSAKPGGAFDCCK
jgi:hypothetical protein